MAGGKSRSSLETYFTGTADAHYCSRRLARQVGNSRYRVAYSRGR